MGSTENDPHSRPTLRCVERRVAGYASGRFAEAQKPSGERERAPRSPVSTGTVSLLLTRGQGPPRPRQQPDPDPACCPALRLPRGGGHALEEGVKPCGLWPFPS